jgi:hypothetical protein
MPQIYRRDNRMKRLKTLIGFAGLLLIILALQACMSGIQLRTASVDRTLISGTYTLLLYGCHYPDQADNVAILVDENSRYPLEIYDIDTSFKVIKSVPAQQAVTDADAFVRCSFHTIWKTQVTRIEDDMGGTIGYEVRPLYVTTEFGTPDVLMISYTLKNGIIRAYIRKAPQAEDRYGEGRDARGSDRHH